MSKAAIAKLLVCAMALAASLPLAAETETIGEYTWTYYIYGDTAGISLAKNSRAVSPLPTGSLTIPSTLGGKPVTSIGESALYGCSGLTSVTIPDSVRSIGDNAFSGCNGLTGVTIPNSVTNIGDYAFAYCDSLTAVEIPNAVMIVALVLLPTAIV